ncbi:Assembly factor cbp4 [Diaporthe australafricana]|uniref:Cytochrome b mRNA-processing protein 4 n=1 Tax=Diaporthe australafricana TaxID=127596 RepID=A0ABR3XJT5_9PEZI
MPKKPTNWEMWAKMILGGGAIIVGGPAFTYWVSPTEEELFKKYNPDLQKKSLANRAEKQREFDDFVGKLKEYSKSDKPIWVVQAEAAEQEKQMRRLQAKKSAEEERVRRETLRKEVGLSAEK